MTAIRLSTWTFKVVKGKTENTVVVKDIVVPADHPDDVKNDIFYKARALRSHYGKQRYRPFFETHRVHSVELHEPISQTAK